MTQASIVLAGSPCEVILFELEFELLADQPLKFGPQERPRFGQALGEEAGGGRGAAQVVAEGTEDQIVDALIKVGGDRPRSGTEEGQGSDRGDSLVVVEDWIVPASAALSVSSSGPNCGPW